MPVTKQVYSLAAPWTNSQCANTFRSAFIDAGLMTEWFDSFTSGDAAVRVMEVTHRPGATFGKTYYVFCFLQSAQAIRYSIASGWNAATDSPVGTQYLDWWATDYTGNGHIPFFTYSVNANAELIRYTSAVDASHSWFLWRQGSTFRMPFTITHPNHQPATWIDCDKNCFVGLHRYSAVVNGHGVQGNFASFGNIRRAFGGDILNGDAIWWNGAYLSLHTASYAVTGRYSNATGTNAVQPGSHYNASWPDGQGTPPSGFSVLLPCNNAAANPAYSANSNPVVTGIPYSFYVPNSNLPADFGLIPHFANNTMAPLDTFVVNAGVEEWEVLSAFNNSDVSGKASLMFGARVVG
jgi:hypothetical protein